MGTTSTGLPWPDGTGKVVNGDDAIKALAEALDPRAPMKMSMGRGGFTTNAQGGISIAVPFTVLGAVGITEALGYSCIRPDGAPAGTLWINVFSTSNGLAAANAFIILHYIAFGN